MSPVSIPVLHSWAHVARQASITELKPLLGKSPAGFSPTAAYTNTMKAGQEGEGFQIILAWFLYMLQPSCVTITV